MVQAMAHQTLSGAQAEALYELTALGFSQRAFAISHRTVRWANGATTNFVNGRLRWWEEQWTLQKSEHTRLSVAASGQQTLMINNSKPQRLADMARIGQWTVPYPVHHRTVRYAHLQQTQPTARKWLEAINIPQPPPFKSSKPLTLLIQ
jgi:hypothetical protein